MFRRPWIYGLLALLVVGVPAARADEKSHRAAAEELLRALGMERTLQASVDQMLDVQLKAQPKLAPLRPVMRRFFAKHLSWAGSKDDLITIYAEEFTESELAEITAFYRTPVGKKTVEKLPVLMGKGAQLGISRVQANQLELQQMIEAELRKNAPQQ